MRNINTLKNTSQFQEVYEKGSSIANRLMVMYILKSEGPTQIGFSVSKKVGNSIIRHRTVRLLRESYLKSKDMIPEGLKIVVIARTQIKGKGQAEVDEAFSYLLKKHGIMQ